MMKLHKKKGFTLAELLIVIAVIALLVAIGIPVFGAQLNSAQHAADLANVRATYAEEVSNGMMNAGATGSVTVDFTSLIQAATNRSQVELDTTNNVISVTKGSATGEFPVDPDVTFKNVP